MNNKKLAVSLALVTGATPLAHAQYAQPPVPVVAVTGAALTDLSSVGVGNDAARLLSNEPGYDTAAGGGFSSLPVVNGFADDRLKIRIDGMEISSACGNHMNPPLSYVAPRQVAALSLLAGVTPVSVGGDSIGGTIEVQSAPPVFAGTANALYTAGRLSVSARSVDHSTAVDADATVATQNLSMTYAGGGTRAHSYRTGGGGTVLDTLYENRNQALTLGLRGEGQQLTLRVGEQRIPYEGFANQYMDLVDDRGRFANAGYEGRFGQITFTARLYWQDTRHGMGTFTDEKPAMTMPMNIHGRNRGYALRADIALNADNRLVVGNEYHTFRLDDRWPPVPGSMMMGPQTFVRINDGVRDRAVLFGEWEFRPAAGWTTLLGLRNEHVKTDAGAVQPYDTGMMNTADAMAAMDFNDRPRARRDDNVDATALARVEPDATSRYEVGVARKTRSPNLYERYTWGRGTMAMTMTNWFGDANGYVGDPDLKREAATVLSASADWHAPDRRWQIAVTPYFSRVSDYIDVDVVGAFHPNMAMDANGNLLRFANHDAKLYGVNVSWHATLSKEFSLLGKAGVTRGARTDGGNLSRIMPPNGSVTLQHMLGAWITSAEAVLVDRKARTDARRLEPATAGYALLNLRTGYQLSKAVRIQGGIANLFDKRYDLPLGGVYLAGQMAAGMGPLRPLPGYGRSFDAGVSIRF